MQYTETTYTRRGNDYPAIQIVWEDLKAAGFAGDGSDDKEIAQALFAAGAPAWVWAAEGWVDEIGYGLYDSRRGVVLTHDAESLAATLNAYTGEDAWNDIILRHPAYDADATDAADPGCANTIIVLKDGSRVIYDEPSGEWVALRVETAEDATPELVAAVATRLSELLPEAWGAGYRAANNEGEEYQALEATPEGARLALAVRYYIDAGSARDGWSGEEIVAAETWLSTFRVGQWG